MLSTSRPYGSPACTVPFASPLNVPLDILRKSPKLHAAYESRLPELPTIPQDVGHVLVHYLHTGTYSSLKPRPTETMTKQVCELKTSIQAYAAARQYDLPDLMRLAEAKIDKFGRNLALPTLLEVARDAYPSLTEGDAWFLDYLRARIRPHLKDPATLMGSNLLDQISGILSPNRVLLRTVLELFCERIVVNPENPAAAAVASTIASPITSPGSSRPVTPQSTAASPKSLLEMRSRSVVREDVTPVRKSKRTTAWTAHDNESEASLSMTPEPITSEPMFEIQPVPETARAVPPPFAELGPVIFDVMPPPGPPIKSAVVPESEVAKIAIEPEVKDEDEVEAKAVNELEAEPELKTAVEPEVKVEAEDEVKIAIEPETKVEADRELKGEPEDEVDGGVKLSDDETNVEAAVETPAQVPVQAPVEAPIEAPVEFKAEVPGEAPRDAPVETEKETEKETATESEAKQEEEATTEAVTVVQRERKDSGKGIDLEPLPKELESIPEHVPEIEAESKTQPQLRPAVLREADSGFWEGPEVESSKASVVELEPVVEPAHELESVTGPKEAPGVDTRDFGANEDVNDKSDNVAEIEVEAPKETVTEALPAQSTSTEGASAETLVAGESDNLESQPELAPLPIKSVEKAPEQLDDAASLAPEIIPVHEQDLPETDKSKDIEAQPEPEKVEPKPRVLEQECLLTVINRFRRRPSSLKWWRSKSPSPRRPRRTLSLFPTMLSPLGPLTPRRLSPPTSRGRSPPRRRDSSAPTPTRPSSPPAVQLTPSNPRLLSAASSFRAKRAQRPRRTASPAALR